VAIVAPGVALDVRRFALINGARFLTEPEGSGINGAIAFGVSHLAALGYDRVIVVNSELPFVRDISWLTNTDGVIVVPDHTGSQTNALSIPAGSGFRVAYGANSFERHCAEARRLGFDPRVVVDPDGISADSTDFAPTLRTTAEVTIDTAESLKTP